MIDKVLRFLKCRDVKMALQPSDLPPEHFRGCGNHVAVADVHSALGNAMVVDHNQTGALRCSFEQRDEARTLCKRHKARSFTQWSSPQKQPSAVKDRFR